MVRFPPWPIPATIPLGVGGIAAILLSAAGMVTGLYALFALDVYPWGWILFAVSFIALWTSVLYTVIWEWDHIPYPELVAPATPTEPPVSDIEPAVRP